GYGIATKGILDVPVLARRISAYTMLVLYLICLYFVVIFTSKQLLNWLNQPEDPFVHLLATIALVFSVSPAHGLAQRLANRLFINNPPLNVGTILREAGSSLNSVLTVDELCVRFHQILSEKLETRDLTILIRQKKQFVQIYPLNDLHRQPRTTRLPELIGEESRLFVRDLIQRHKLTPHTRQIFQELKQENSAAAISLTRNGSLLGVLLLGERASGRLYAHEEAIAVEGLRDLFSVSYEKARLYTELQNSRIYMDLLLKNLVNGVIAADASGTITTCNHEAATILRMDPEQLANKSIHNLPPPLEALLQQVFETDQVVRDREIILPRTGEGPRYLNVGAALFHDLENSVIGGLLVLQDRTTIRALEDQVKRSERLASLGTLSAGMAHEIKNPLVTLKTFTQLLPERFEDPDFRETFSTLAGKEIGRIDTLVNQLLSFARPAKPKLDPVRLHDLLKSHIKWFRQQAEDSNVEIEEHYDAERDVILADDDQLRQVFLNLLLNAQQVMSEGGRITLRTRLSGIFIQVSVSDTGRGIDPDDLDHVFDPFFTTKSSGTGLGLAVAHQILTEHKAEIRVESKLGKGSTFDLYFPLHQPDSSS
nr:ATP-binding protein [Kiritimatiellia bacterium]